MKALLVLLLVLPAVAHAQIDPACAGIAKPSNYDEQTQQDFLQNYFALASTYSGLHAPVAEEPGHATVALELSGIPPLACAHRFVLDHTKTEHTNITPVLPRPRLRVALPALGKLVPYVSFAYVPPITVLKTRNVIVSGEIGGGARFGHFEVGARFHATTQKTVADIATAFNPTDPPVLDLFLATTFGGDALVGLRYGPVAPYLSIGFTDASTFFYVGDDGNVSNNHHPYAGAVGSLGIDALAAQRLRLAGEVYAAPGGVSRPDKTDPLLHPVSRYGRLVTGRVLVGIELGSLAARKARAGDAR